MPVEHRVIRWLLALPLLTQHELATLCRVPVESVYEAVRSLREAGWLFGFPISEPGATNELDEYVLAVSDAGMAALRLHPEQSELALGEVAWWQCSRGMVGEFLAQAPITRAVNHAIAAVAETASQGDLGVITWASLLPPMSARGELSVAPEVELPTWMPAGHAEVRWQVGGHEAWRGGTVGDS